MADLATALEKLTQVAPPSYNTDLVRQAWNSKIRARRDAKQYDNDGSELSYRARRESDPLAWAYVTQLWTDHVIVELDNDGGVGRYLRVPYTVSAPARGIEDVSFGEPVRVREVFVAAAARTRADSLARVCLAGEASS